MILIALMLGAMIVSGCCGIISKDTMMANDEAKDAFQKATIAGAKNCAPCEYATAEAYLAHANHEMAEKDELSGHLGNAIKIVKEKSLEAIRLCQKPAAPAAAAPVALPPPPPPPPKVPVFEMIYFDMNKSNISPTASKALDRNGMLLKDNPNVKVEIGGHSDGSRSEAANQKIAEQRAQSAKKYIQDKYNIPESRMTVKSYGSSKPVADNKTNEGRAKNRRVEFMILK
jgi:outer membrane protein OmpA-like peptidoglycan-associated protein